MLLEQIAEVVREIEVARLAAGKLPALRPDEEDRRARPVLPPHDGVRSDLLEVESTRIGAGTIRLEPSGPKKKKSEQTRGLAS